MNKHLTKCMAIFISIAMIISIIPADTFAFAAASISGTNTSITAMKNANFKSTGGSAAYTNEYQVIFAITPYSLGDSKGDNILNKYIIGKNKTKNDLVYCKGVEDADQWGYVVQGQGQVSLTRKNNYSGVFIDEQGKEGQKKNKDTGTYIPTFAESMDVLIGDNDGTAPIDELISLGAVEINFAGYDNQSHKAKLMADLYP